MVMQTGSETTFPKQEDPGEKGMATHFTLRNWRIWGTEEPDGLQSTGSQIVRHV